MNHINTAIHTNTPAAQLYLWVVQNIDYRKLVSRSKTAFSHPNATIKAVLFEFSVQDCLPCGMAIRDAFFSLSGEDLVHKLVGVPTYVRRKPIYPTDGSSRLSKTIFQVVVMWNPPPSFPNRGTYQELA